MNHDSLDQFANGKVKEVVPDAIFQMMMANSSMTEQVMASKETMARFVSLITEMVYESVRNRSA
jgi:hypothetical protein